MANKIYDASVASTTIDFYTSLNKKFENDANGNAIYVGYAKPGIPTDAPKWAIQNITYDVNNSATSVSWASNKANSFSFVWDDRTTYAY